MDCFGRTDIGCKRESNQDQFLIADLLKSIVIHRSSLGYDNETQFSGDSRADRAPLEDRRFVELRSDNLADVSTSWGHDVDQGSLRGAVGRCA